MDCFAVLERAFYEPSAEIVAPALLGHWLIRQTAEGPCGGPIVETEAYLAADPACHAAPGLTERNRVMFGQPGHAYVYFIYGVHFCVNAVCRPAGIGEAVLIRALEPMFGVEMMERHRPVRNTRSLANGPGKLCQALKIDRGLDGTDLCDRHGPLFIAANPGRTQFLEEGGPVIRTTRIGITKAAELDLRFYLERSSSVS